MTSARKSEKRNHYRGKARPGRRVDLTFQTPGGEPTRAVTRNIGVGGAFIGTDEAVAVGTELLLRIELPGHDLPIEVRAEVRWAIADNTDDTDNTGKADDADDAGLGVKFLNLEVEALLTLSEYFASLTGSDA